MEKIYTFPTDKISPLIKEIGFNSADYMILEKVDDITFDNFQEKAFEEWEKGIIFSNKMEFKWRKVDAQFHVVFSGDDVSFSGDVKPEQVKIAETDFPVLLWGQRSPQMSDFPAREYIELPIPRKLPYPIESDFRIKIQLKVQKNGKDEIIGYRFSELCKEAHHESL